MKVMLILPPFTQSRRAMKRCLIPLGLAYMAAYLEQHGIIPKILDCIVEGYETETSHPDKPDLITYGLTDEEIRLRIEEFNPDFVGVSCLISTQSDNAHRVCKLAKEGNPEIQTIMGGAHPSAMPEIILRDPNVNHIVIGEGEQSILEIVKGKKKKIVKSPLLDINDLPWPARHLLSMEKYLKINMPTSVFSPHDRVTQIETSRGCPFNCIFCCTTHFWGRRFRGRDPKKVLDEIRFLKERYGIEELDVIDANMIVNKGRFVEILKGLKDIDITWANPGGMWVGGLDTGLLDLMKESGCYQISFAVENSSEYILDKVIRKPSKLSQVKPLVDHCKKIGIDTHAFFVTGFPEETLEDIKRNFDFAEEMGFTSVSFNIINPLPGSDIYKKYAKSTDTSKIELRYAQIEHPEISKIELEKLVDGFNKKYNSSLLWRDPVMFYRKYVGTLIRKPSYKFMRKVFGRQ